MTSLLDVWRAADPEATLLGGSTDLLSRPVRGVARSRMVAPHLPLDLEGQILVADASLVPRAGLDAFVGELGAGEAEPIGIWVVAASSPDLERPASRIPILVGSGAVAARAESIAAYLESEPQRLAEAARDVRLAGAEAALADPQPAAPAGVLAAMLRRGVAVEESGRLLALHPRAAGRALATRFAALHARSLAQRSSRSGASRQAGEDLWVLERPVGSDATAWLFDDLPFARIDEVALEALAVTLRALLRRRPSEPGRARQEPRVPPSTGDPIRDTLLAVARANGRIAPAARSLGVHRNTVLYRLRVASAELGIDPRRPDDALRLLRDAEPG